MTFARRIGLLGLFTILAFSVSTQKSQAQPAADFTWNNFVSVSTFWANANNWSPSGPPTSNIDRSLWFGSSNLQTVTGYTTTNASGAFNVNALTFNAFSASLGGVTVTNPVATKVLG